ncbi:MAG: Flavoprotein, HI0933 family [Candidatus Magasanikbacteria bacterium GW2011_GWD2_43_18]|uniref:Flavoprotein, HI0933 family n=1 Tax=Candidatus Magasanikbacteria bacterium GW2011_GWE2_42_7 TaxID=1619052 RepID=A0A0G1EFA4_9BACT|nr:MAG: Flavoprotein, HI0933 family [Candidatus Magasanikbacteria bacterium GW2011_GWC2_42_27]KKS73188.1 MAG: Flavoprotein, HI0933 family [Candidatus Magasanikbacteria bacterium GW2011_GWE2_42_7]KKT05137.1 MAG: Flavoprotein, HI0933 family [Candidatus Magasanikbacteria bacterium GW2011_GWD2_43_18]KKT25772.1 MAG: Flavoprotein, HI0933 family [Candidatus Magasanikbacteria bacterium GW2011_GWA2_43_9]HBB38202.1 aminoacetone oxidase family FAD-binding enzyme [Candidatus Magasanikbacteria bacterium]
MRVAIVGGGAAGMMCAATIAEEYPHVEIFVLEKNASLGKKVIISGGGRCNVTTGIEDIALVLEKYPRGNKFLQSAMHRFSPSMVYAWFEAHGVPLKCEDDLRVFPVSNNGKDIVAVFEDIFEEADVHVKYKHNVQDITKKETGFVLSFKDQNDLEVDKVVMALGGQAYRHTGSTGDGYYILEQLGHTITPLAPSLNSFLTKESWPKELSGLSFQKATIFVHGQKKQYNSTGPFLFTHTGVSGPAVFALSSRIAFLDYDKTNPLAIQIDVFPDQTEQELLERLQQTREEHMQKTFKNTLPHLVAKSLAEEMCIQLDIPLDKKNADMSKKELARIATYVKGIPLEVIGRGAGDEFVTAGGVELTEVDPKTMESKICPGLYFAGEILDVDGYTGGFNLQASWATGNAAGIAIGSNVPLA